jgi:predicted nuclease with TOPRIM domain
MVNYSNKEIRDKINELTMKKQTLIGKKEALLNQYITLCENIDRSDLIEIDKQLLQEEITTNESHMKQLISKIENVVMRD